MTRRVGSAVVLTDPFAGDTSCTVGGAAVAGGARARRTTDAMAATEMDVRLLCGAGVVGRIAPPQRVPNGRLTP